MAVTLRKLVQSKTQQYIQQWKIATYFNHSNHHQADISVHGHDMFIAYSMGSILLTFAG